MTPEQRKIEIERHQFLLEFPWANNWDFESFRAFKLSKGKLQDPRKSERFLVKKTRWEVRNGK